MRRQLAQLTVPPPVRDAVLERAGRLAPGAQAVLRAMAVLGEPAAEATLAAVTGLPPGLARAGLSQGLACGLLTEDSGGRCRCGTHLASRAVYETIPGPERRLLHRRAGHALEALSPPPAAAFGPALRRGRDPYKRLRYGEQAALLHDLVTRAGLAARSVARLANKIILVTLPDDRLHILAGAGRVFQRAARRGPRAPLRDAAPDLYARVYLTMNSKARILKRILNEA